MEDGRLNGGDKTRPRPGDTLVRIVRGREGSPPGVQPYCMVNGLFGKAVSVNVERCIVWYYQNNRQKLTYDENSTFPETMNGRRMEDGGCHSRSVSNL